MFAEEVSVAVVMAAEEVEEEEPENTWKLSPSDNHWVRRLCLSWTRTLRSDRLD